MMISESQERMVAIVRPSGSARSRRSASAGSSTTRRSARSRTRVSCARSGTARSSARSRAAPHRRVPALRASSGEPRQASLEQPVDGAPPTAAALLELIGSDALRSRAFVYRRYDQLVQSRTVRRPGLDAAVLRLRPSHRGLARLARRSGPASRRSTRSPAARSRPRGGAERRLRRRRAARLHRLPQLRQPREGRRSAGSWPRRSKGWRRPARRSSCRSSRATSRSTTTPNGRSIHPTPSSAASGLVPDVRRVPARLARGRRDPARVRRLGRRSPARSTRRATASSSGVPPALDLAAEAALVELALAASRRRASLVARRRRGRARGRARGGGDLLRHRRRARSAATTPSRCSARAAARRSSPCPPGSRVRAGRRRTSPCAGSASSAATDAPRRAASASSGPPGRVSLMCGVFGVRSAERDVARLSYFGLYALQHRGQESAGIAVSDRGPDHDAARHGSRRPGLRRGAAAGASRARSRSGTRATRPPARRSGRTRSRVVHHGAGAPIALGHNGNLTNARSFARSSRGDGRRARRRPPTRS